MAKQTIDIGSSPNKGDGDPLRTAFTKINQNFDELYAGGFADPESVGTNLSPDTDATYNLGSADSQWADVHISDFLYLNGQRIEALPSGALLVNGSGARESADIVGSVFGDDSTLLIDGINSSINLDGTVKGDIIPDTDVAYDLGSATNRFKDLYLSGSTIDLGGTTLSIVGGELQLGGVKVPTTADVAATVASAVSAPTGDLTGSVFADDSTLLVDGVAGKIVGAIDTAQQARFTDSILLQNGSDLVTIGDPAGTAFQLPNKAFSLQGGGVGGGNYVFGLTAEGYGSIVTTNQFNLISGAGMAIGTSTGLTIQGTVDVSSSVTAPSFVGDVTGSVFADDSTLLVDGVNGKLYAETLTTLGIFGNPTLAVNADIIALDAQSGNLTLQTTNRIINNFGSAWEVQGVAASMVLNDDGIIPSELSVNIDVVDFGTGNTIDMQGNSVLFDSASIQDFAPGNVYANSGQYLYVTGKHAGGSATNVAFIYDAGNNRPRQIFYGKTEFGNNGAAPIIDFDGTTIQNWTDPNVVNTNDSGGAWITVGQSVASIDNLTVRIANDGLNQIEVQFNYDPNGTASVSASGDAENEIGLMSLAPGNTTWTTVNLITMVGTTKTFTVTDHGYHKVYRGTVVSRNMPDGGPTPGDAYCVIERLK